MKTISISLLGTPKQSAWFSIAKKDTAAPSWSAPSPCRLEWKRWRARTLSRTRILRAFLASGNATHREPNAASWSSPHPRTQPSWTGHRWCGWWSARLAALADGSLTITAAMPAGAHAQSSVRIEGSRAARPFRFARDIGGILTKRGCNQAACHGGVKGRGGLKLSANALYPKDDYGWITKGGVYQVLTAEVKGERIPRVDVGAP